LIGLCIDIVIQKFNIVHAMIQSEEAKQFYEKCGFTASLLTPMTLMITVNDAIAFLQ